MGGATSRCPSRRNSISFCTGRSRRTTRGENKKGHTPIVPESAKEARPLAYPIDARKTALERPESLVRMGCTRTSVSVHHFLAPAIRMGKHGGSNVAPRLDVEPFVETIVVEREVAGTLYQPDDTCCERDKQSKER